MLGLKKEGRPKMLTSINKEKIKEQRGRRDSKSISAWIFGLEGRRSTHSHAPVLVPAHFTQKSALNAIPLHVPAPGGDRRPVRICTMSIILGITKVKSKEGEPGVDKGHAVQWLMGAYHWRETMCAFEVHQSGWNQDCL